jgi:hypothetical protein
MCLVEFRPDDGVHCPGCRADSKRVVLMPVSVYLANVDFEFVEEFWRNNQKAGYELKQRVLDRLAFLRQRQEGEFGGALDLSLARPPSDPRIKVLN